MTYDRNGSRRPGKRRRAGFAVRAAWPLAALLFAAGAASAGEAPSALADLERAGGADAAGSPERTLRSFAAAPAPDPVSVRALKEPVTPDGEAALRPLVDAVVSTLYGPENYAKVVAGLGPDEWPFAAKFPRLLRYAGELRPDAPEKLLGYLRATKRRDAGGGIVVSLRCPHDVLMAFNLAARRFFVFRPDGRLFQSGTLDYSAMKGTLD